MSEHQDAISAATRCLGSILWPPSTREGDVAAWDATSHFLSVRLASNTMVILESACARRTCSRAARSPTGTTPPGRGAP